jgi:DNA topoisomerase-3
MQTEEGRWRVEFDEPWAKEGAKPPEADDPASVLEAAAAAAVTASADQSAAAA